ncbi:MAG: hypothetical protein ACHP6H_05180 [Legionellales bacterium]
MDFTEKMYTLVQGQSKLRHKAKRTESVFHLWVLDDNGVTVVSHIEDKLVTHRVEELEIA